MARINIEDSLWSDPRFLRFCVRLGNEATAIGYIIMAFKLAQKHWCPEKRPVPSAEWSVSGLPQELLDCGLAEERDGGIYVRGSETQFAWWFQRQEAGKKGGRPKAGANRKKPAANRELTGAKRAEPSSSSSFSSSSSSSFSNSDSEFIFSENAKSSNPEKNSQTWEAYREAYRERYQGEDPVRNASVNSKIAQLVKRLGDDAPEVARFFVRHNKQFYVQNLHPIGMLLADAESLRTQWALGKQVLTTTGREVERMQHNNDTWDEAARILNERRRQNEAV